MNYLRIGFSLLFCLMMPLTLVGQEKERSIVNNQVNEEEECREDDLTILISEEEIRANELAEAPRRVGLRIDLRRVFSGSPTIYTLLFFLSMVSVTLFLYTVLRWRTLGGYSDTFKKTLTRQLEQENFNEAYLLCQNKKDILSRMITSALRSQGFTKNDLESAMQREATLATSATWQRISILNDIALIAPMLGLMGTVLGMFYAFYDLNRSLDTISKLFDGLGISVGTTVAGLLVALLSLLLHTFCKHTLVRRLVLIEQEAHTFVSLLPKTTVRGE